MTSTSPVPSTAAVVDDFFNAFGAGDVDGIVELFDDNADVYASGAPNVPWAGRHSGKEGIAKFFATFGEVLTAPDSFEISHKIVDGTEAVAIARCVFGVQATGKKFTNRFAVHFTVIDGHLTRYNVYEDSYEISEAFVA